MLARPAAAAGDSPEDLRLVISAAGHYGGGANVGDARLFVGWRHVMGQSTSASNARGFFMLGVTAGAGKAYVRDPRGIDGIIDVPRLLVGPEARAGVLFGAPARPVELYAAVAPLRFFASALTSRLPEAGDAFGLRGGVGLALPRSWWAWNWALGCRDGECVYAYPALLLPNTFELGSERVGGTWRFGGSLGYSF